MAAIRQFLVLVCVGVLNIFLEIHWPNDFHYLFGMEFITGGILMICKNVWTAEFLRMNILSWPGYGYLFDENLVVKKSLVRVLAVLMMMVGLIIFRFGR